MTEYRKPPKWLPADLLEQESIMQIEACAFAKEHAAALEDAGRLTPLDRPAFVNLCVAWGQMAEARAVLRKEGMTTQNDRGEVKRHPASMILASAEQAFQRYATAFGMTPKARDTARGNPADAPDRPENSGEGLLD